jgi:glycosyltransferase involved in cell wall biosynthesis
MKNLKFSIITPEHSPKNITYLEELYESIVCQTYDNWEWVLYLNGKCRIEHIPIKIIKNNKVKIIEDKSVNNNIGAVKRKAFFCGSGDVLVEVDHDDLITQDCLSELNAAYQDESVGFVYSDNAPLSMKDEFIPYNPDFGWSFKNFQWKNKTLKSMSTPDATSHSVGLIWYAPDHVRSWRSSVYVDIGGHNSDLSICDDHELMIRTYLKSKMFKIDKTLYIYRITGDNTWLERNQSIQIKTVELFHQYAFSLAERDADINGLSKISLGTNCPSPEGYVCIGDGSKYIDCDLNDGIPMPDNSVAVLRAFDIIEHLRDPVKTMREIHRVLCHGGWAFIEVPSTDGRGAFQDPTHVSYWNENSFWYYTNAEKAKYIKNKDIKFQSFRLDTKMYENNIAMTSAWLVAIKPGGKRIQGKLEI